MNQKHLLSIIPIVVAIATFPNLAEAQQKGAAKPKYIDFGKMEYEAKCASCHGLKGKGDGPAARYMTQKVTDLTTLAKNHGNILPAERMFDMIVGKAQAPGPHGSREMPVWGNVYRIEGQPMADERYDSESYIRGRVLMLIEYIHRIQVKK